MLVPMEFMKGFLKVAGCAALGAIGLQAAEPTETEGHSSVWSLQAHLRGFYDDNPTTSPKGFEDPSFGVEFGPGGNVNWTHGPTSLQLSYNYTLRYYESRNDHPVDQNHEFNGFLRHIFNDRYKLELNESFVIAQEPEVLDNTGVISVPLRTNGNNLRNNAGIDFFAQLTEILGLVVGYSNTMYDYQQEGFRSRSALLDRMQHLGTVNLRWQARQSTVGLIGYQFGLVNYTSDDEIFFGVPADVRDSRSHYLYLGVDHQFSSQLNASARLGGQYTEYYNIDDSEVSPYADVSLTYTYKPNSFLQGGIRHTRNQTDVAVMDFTGATTLDQESTTLYVAWTHEITPRFKSNVLAQFQNSAFNGGGVDGETDNFFLAGLDFAYQFNRYLSAEAGYNYDRLTSDLGGRSFTRNRVYLGLRVKY